MASKNDISPTLKAPSTMKALPMLDHVMLWVARTWIALLFLFLVLSELIQQPYQQSFRYGNGPILLLCVPMTSLAALVCLWSLRQVSARLCLGAGATLFLFIQIRGLIFFAWKPEPLLLAVSILGFMSVLWVAIRPPQNPSHPVTPSENHPLPNPGNLVSPV